MFVVGTLNRVSMMSTVSIMFLHICTILIFLQSKTNSRTVLCCCEGEGGFINYSRWCPGATLIPKSGQTSSLLNALRHFCSVIELRDILYVSILR